MGQRLADGEAGVGAVRGVAADHDGLLLLVRMLLTPKLLLGTLALIVTAALGALLAITRGKRLRDFSEEDGKRLVVAGKALVVLLVLLVFAVLFVINNP